MPKLFTPNSGDLNRMVDVATAKFDEHRFRARFGNLIRYVDRSNIETRLFYSQGKIFDLRNFTLKDKDALMSRIDCDLSPENLCCDGELSGPALRQKAQHLNGAKAELEMFPCL